MGRTNTRFNLTDHAIEQFITRKRENGSFDKSKKFISQQIKEYVYKLPEKTRTGEDKWHVPSANCVLISKYEYGTNVVTTIISDTRLVSELNKTENFYIESLLALDTTATEK